MSRNLRIADDPDPPPPLSQSRQGIWYERHDRAVARMTADLRQRVLVVDADTVFGPSLQHNLEQDGYQVVVARSEAHAMLHLRGLAPQLVILSQLMVEAGGGTLLRAIRREAPDAAVLMHGLRPVDAAEMPGFRLGIDEFLLRPATVAEVHGRIEAMLRRVARGFAAVPTASEIEPVRLGRVVADPAARTVTVAGAEVPLRPKEFDLLMALVRRRGRIASRAELLSEVWGYAEGVSSRTIDSHIYTLREKLEEDPDHPRLILTARKSGYRIGRA
jgi:DNA-binding response OmpR family regulator